MFGRRENRKRRSWKERLRDWVDSASALVRRVGPYGVLAAVAVTIPYLVWTGYQHVITSPYFEVSDIDIRGAEHARIQQLAEKAHLVHGVNIFDVDPKAAASVFEASPWVRRATVDRKMPDAVVVTLREHRPAALLVEPTWTVVSEQGAVIDQIDGEVPETFLDLPLITGLSAGDLKRERSRTLLREALQVAAMYDEMNLDETRAISDIHVDPVVGMVLTLEGTGAEVRLGRGDYRKRLERLRTVRRSLAERGIEPAYILLDHENAMDRVTIGRRGRHGRRQTSAQ
ncbi:MAG: cell division protein FtsQ/DivIB [Bradymonadaceae bacterium]